MGNRVLGLANVFNLGMCCKSKMVGSVLVFLAYPNTSRSPSHLLAAQKYEYLDCFGAAGRSVSNFDMEL